MNRTSPEKLAANRANAQHSTGPKTEAGKQSSSQNAVKHGLNAAKPLVQAGEEEEFERHGSALYAELRPENALEADICAKIHHASWSLRRLRQLEEALLDNYNDPFGDPEAERKMNAYARHTARFERVYRNGLRDLRQLQTDRQLFVQASGCGPLALTPLTDMTKLLKRTQQEAKNRPVEPEPELDDEDLAAAEAGFEKFMAANTPSEPKPAGS